MASELPSMSTCQAARALGVSLGTVRRWADEGYLGVSKTPGGQRRFSEADIARFLQQMRDAGQNSHAS